MIEPTDTSTSPLVTAALAVGLAAYVVAVVWLLAVLIPAILVLVDAHLLPAIVDVAEQLPGQLAAAPVWVQLLVGVVAVTGLGALVWGGRASAPVD
jgi:hypothetical protein